MFETETEVEAKASKPRPKLDLTSLTLRGEDLDFTEAHVTRRLSL